MCKDLCQSLFKTSHVTRRSSLKHLLGMQVQLLSHWMGKHQILTNCSLRLRYQFNSWNHQWNRTTVINCFFCSNSVYKKLISQARSASAHAQSWVRVSELTVSIETGTSNGSSSDALTLPISYWLFHSEGGASCDWATILSVAFLPVQN